MIKIRAIYAIVNTTNFKKYIGSTRNLAQRFWDHKKLLRKGKHKNPHLQASWNKNGEATFKFVVVEYCPEMAEDVLRQREKKWIQGLMATDRRYGYNTTDAASIASDFNVARRTVYSIKNGRSWSWVQ